LEVYYVQYEKNMLQGRKIFEHEAEDLQMSVAMHNKISRYREERHSTVNQNRRRDLYPQKYIFIFIRTDFVGFGKKYKRYS
jgi:hypothetical protein